MATRPTWHNWMGNLTCQPDEICRPTSLDGLKKTVRQAVARGQRIRAVGKGHSWSPLVPTDGTLVDMCGLTRVLSHDREACTITVETGIGLQDLTVAAAELGMMLPSHPDATTLTIGGIVSTSSNGSGLEQDLLGDAVIAFQIVRADGECVPLTAESDDIHAARLSMGMLGIIYAITIQCLPAIAMRVERRTQPLDATLQDLVATTRDHTSVMMFWFPYTDQASMMYWDPAPNGTIDFGPWQRMLTILNQWISRRLLGIPTSWMMRWLPSTTVLVMKLALLTTRPSTKIEGAADAYHFEYVNPLLWDACYAVPLEKAEGAWRALMSLIGEFRAKGRYPINMTTTARYTRGSRTLLQPAHDRETCFLEAITFKNTPHTEEFYRRFQDVMMNQFEGRPHWAKVWSDVPRVREAYWDRLVAFESVRRRWDPERVFLNDFLETLLEPFLQPRGPVPSAVVRE